MSLDKSISEMWEALFHGQVVPKKFWKVDNISGDGWEPMDENLDFNTCEMVEQVTSNCGISLSHYRMEMPVTCIGGIVRQQTQHYYELVGVAYSPATREQPEDADPFLIFGSGSLQEAFLRLFTEDAAISLDCWAEGKAEHDWYVATGGEGGLGVW